MSRRQQLDRPGPTGGPLADDTGCTVLHADMDAFYASVTLREHPDLVGTPVIIGGRNRGVVLSATYEARRFGVHSAMPMSRARRLCPSATVLPPHFEAYAEVSKGVMAIFRSVTPLVEPLSLDEAFLDVAGARRRLGPPAVIAAEIRAQVLDAHGVTCSVGVASTKFVAKVASTRCKPDGLLVVARDGVLEFLHPLPVGALWGVGERTERELHRLGLRTVGDLARAPIASLVALLGDASARHLAALADGRDHRTVQPGVVERSIGAEETFAVDTADLVVLRRELLRLADRVGRRARKAGLAGRTVAIKVRYSDFTTITRSRTLPDRTDVTKTIYETAVNLLDGVAPLRSPLRLVGVRLESVAAAGGMAEQLALDEPTTGWREVERVADAASRRFGSAALRPATLVEAQVDDPARPDSRRPP